MSLPTLEYQRLATTRLDGWLSRRKYPPTVYWGGQPRPPLQIWGSWTESSVRQYLWNDRARDSWGYIEHGRSGAVEYRSLKDEVKQQRAFKRRWGGNDNIFKPRNLDDIAAEAQLHSEDPADVSLISLPIEILYLIFEQVILTRSTFYFLQGQDNHLVVNWIADVLVPQNGRPGLARTCRVFKEIIYSLFYKGNVFWLECTTTSATHLDVSSSSLYEFVHPNGGFYWSNYESMRRLCKPLAYSRLPAKFKLLVWDDTEMVEVDMTAISSIYVVQSSQRPYQYGGHYSYDGLLRLERHDSGLQLVLNTSQLPSKCDVSTTMQRLCLDVSKVVNPD